MNWLAYLLAVITTLVLFLLGKSYGLEVTSVTALILLFISGGFYLLYAKLLAA